jgi:hypothetical protein
MRIVCLALGHRLRVVQEFSPTNRRVKCERCGGDWAMEDQLHVAIDWHTEFEQFWRERGVEIAEPLPVPEPLPEEPLTWEEFVRAIRWPGVLVIAVVLIVGVTITEMGWPGALVACAIEYALVRFLGQWAIDRAYERKRNTLRA